jgi:hypothetical protein
LLSQASRSFSETKYSNYPAWINGENSGIQIVALSWEKQNIEDLNKCHGLLLSGGVDIDPFFYEPEILNYPNQPVEWNRKRDLFEMDLFKVATQKKIPILGDILNIDKALENMRSKANESNNTFKIFKSIQYLNLHLTFTFYLFNIFTFLNSIF